VRDPPVREDDRVAREARLRSAASSAEADRADVLAPTGPEEERTRVQQDAAVAGGPNDVGADLSGRHDRFDRVATHFEHFRGAAAPAHDHRPMERRRTRRSRERQGRVRGEDAGPVVSSEEKRGIVSSGRDHDRPSVDANALRRLAEREEGEPVLPGLRRRREEHRGRRPEELGAGHGGGMKSPLEDHRPDSSGDEGRGHRTTRLARTEDRHLRGAFYGRGQERPGGGVRGRCPGTGEPADETLVEPSGHRRPSQSVQAVDPTGRDEADRSQDVPGRGGPGVLGRDGIPRCGFVPAGPYVGAAVDPDETAGAVADPAERALGPMVLDRPMQEGKAVAGEGGEEGLAVPSRARPTAEREVTVRLPNHAERPLGTRARGI
jgi:hypothetical protein